MNIKVLGPGCTRCHMLADVVRDVVAELEIEATLEHVTEPGEIGQYRILFTPGLVINGELVCAGRVPSKAEVVRLITAKLNEKPPSEGEQGGELA